MRGEKRAGLRGIEGLTGSPPLARGKVTDKNFFAFAARITPACAGKRAARASAAFAAADHPRLRGEKLMSSGIINSVKGSPPLARGKADSITLSQILHRITPACAGKSDSLRFTCHDVKDHPRLRGEKIWHFSSTEARRGSPPLARGKADDQRMAKRGAGITPACAGKSPTKNDRGNSFGDHPRLRGEKFDVLFRYFDIGGSPPLARGKVILSAAEMKKQGITPACAGKREQQLNRVFPARDHPRLRGEKLPSTFRALAQAGSPPLARGKVLSPACQSELDRITPACAGKRTSAICHPPSLKDHPRLRGEKYIPGTNVTPAQGSPPLARGKVSPIPSSSAAMGITPACAGKRENQQEL